MARKSVKISAAYVAIIIQLVAKQASQLTHGPEGVLEMPFEELSVGELLKYLDKNYKEQQFELREERS